MMGKTVAIQKLGQTLRLSPERCIFWQEKDFTFL